MKKAFEAKLLPQDPTDEPADKLLERIKAEKTNEKLKPKPKRNRSNQGNRNNWSYFENRLDLSGI